MQSYLTPFILAALLLVACQASPIANKTDSLEGPAIFSTNPNSDRIANVRDDGTIEVIMDQFKGQPSPSYEIDESYFEDPDFKAMWDLYQRKASEQPEDDENELQVLQDTNES